jgi:glucosamine--fructose-6-phosphate aminotransferase (isomerizing)
VTRFLQDILDEPGQLATSLESLIRNPSLPRAAEAVASARHVFLTGIGSSWHAGMAVSTIFASRSRPVHLFDASDLLHFAAFPRDSAVIALSRSGRSVEIVRLLAKAKASGATIIAVTNAPDSPLGVEAEVLLYTAAAFDHLVSVTMYTVLGLAGGVLACSVDGAIDSSLVDAIGEALGESPRRIATWRESIAKSPWLVTEAPTYFIGRGASLASAFEARLLWEEACKAPASSYTTGGFRHGPQEMVREGVRIGMWVGSSVLREEDLALASDLRSAGARLMLIGPGLSEGSADLELSVPPLPDEWQFLVDIIPAQLASEHLARMRGVDCDSFRLCSYLIDKEGGLPVGAPGTSSS